MGGTEVPMPAPEGRAVAHTASQPIAVVVVDDSAVYRQGVVRALERDARFVVAGSFDDGDARAVAACRCDVLLLDYLLQTTTGIDLLEDLRALGVKTPATLISASLTDELRAEALEVGFAATLDKSLPRAAICDALAATVAEVPRLRLLNGASAGPAS